MAFHREMGCERKHLEFEAKEKRRAELIASGIPVRCSAIGVGDDRVHVLFDAGGGKRVGYCMALATYHAIPYGEVATVDDYRKHGDVEDAPWGPFVKNALVAS